MAVLRGRPLTHVRNLSVKPKPFYRAFSFFFLHENSQRGCIRVRKFDDIKADTHSHQMGASIARKRTHLGRRVLRHKVAQGCAFSCIMTCFSCTGWSFDTQSVLVHFLPNMCLRVASEVTLLEIPPCQTPMCGVAYSCSYVLLIILISHLPCMWTLSARGVGRESLHTWQWEINKKKEEICSISSRSRVLAIDHVQN